MTDRAQSVWERIETWFSQHAPDALDALGEGASEADFQALESVIGRSLPTDVRAVYARHNGDVGDGMHGLFGGFDAFLSCESIAENWKMSVEIAEQMGNNEEHLDFWRRQVEDGIISIGGPVKPFTGSRSWIPITNMNGDVVRYLDFDPAIGGTPGQVIEVDLEGCSHVVIADSLVDFLEIYAEALERGDVTIDDDGMLEWSEPTSRQPQLGELPTYLREVQLNTYDPGAAGPDPDLDSLSADQTVEIVGKMGRLMGGPETIFTIRTPHGSEFECLATKEATSGYGAIAIKQYARIKAVRFSNQVQSQFVQYGMSREPQLLVLEYTMLVDPEQAE